MDERQDDLSTQVRELSRRLAEVERRLAAVEHGRTEPPPEPVRAGPVREREAVAAPSVPTIPLNVLLSLVGRTLVVLGGGFLLRAITEAGVLTRPVGTAVGMLYAFFWFWITDRQAGKGQTRSAFFFGLAGVLIAFPILAEAALKYAFLSPHTSILGASATGLVGLGVGWRRRLRAFAWLVVAATAFSGLVLGVKAGTPVTVAFCLNALGLAVLWVGYSRHWLGLAWFTAVLVDVSVLVVVILLLAVPDAKVRFGLDPTTVIAIQFSAVAVYLGSIGARTLIRHRDVLHFEAFQTLCLLILWLGGALHLAGSTGVALLPLGVGCLLMAAFSYGITFTVLDRRVGGRRNFIFYATLALVFALFGGDVLLDSTARSLVFAALGLAVTGFGIRYGRVTLIGHSVFYLAAAAWWSGTVGAASRALVGSGGFPADWLRVPVAGVLLALIAVALAPPVAHGRTWGPMAHAPRVLLFVLVVLAVDGFVAALLSPVVSAASDPAARAALRTSVLALSAYGLAHAGRRPRFAEATWLVYPLLLAGGLKLVLEDLPAGRPATLFVSLAVYGGVLILTPRLLRRPATH